MAWSMPAAALQALIRWVDQTINKIEPPMNESDAGARFASRPGADLFAARVDYNEAEKAFIAASSDEVRPLPAFGHLAQMGEALSPGLEEQVKSFLNVGEQRLG